MTTNPTLPKDKPFVAMTKSGRVIHGRKALRYYYMQSTNGEYINYPYDEDGNPASREADKLGPITKVMQVIECPDEEPEIEIRPGDMWEHKADDSCRAYVTAVFDGIVYWKNQNEVPQNASLGLFPASFNYIGNTDSLTAGTAWVRGER